MPAATSAQYRKRLIHAKSIVLQLPETMLDLILKGEYVKRYNAYKKVTWYLALVDTSEIGVWKKAGGLPLSFTRGSLAQTAEFVRISLHKKARISKERAQKAIPSILNTALPYIQKEKYLLPIVLPGGTMGRSGLKKMKGDIDDGCMRAIALAISGKKKIKVYLGKRN